MGIVNLGWFDLGHIDFKMNPICRETIEQCDAGWPEKLSCIDLSGFQRPKNKYPSSMTGVEYIFSHCGFAQIISKLVRSSGTIKHWGSEYTLHTPTDFAAWLATQREEPSVHVQSWLDAYKTEPEQATVHIHPKRRARDSLTSVFDEAARQAGGDRAKMRAILADQKHPQADKIKRLSQNALTKRISAALKSI